MQNHTNKRLSIPVQPVSSAISPADLLCTPTRTGGQGAGSVCGKACDYQRHVYYLIEDVELAEPRFVVSTGFLSLPIIFNVATNTATSSMQTQYSR